MNFRNLNNNQSSVFEQVAIGRDGGHNYATIKALLRKGLIERLGELQVTQSGLTVEVARYQVPLPVHLEWGEWCVMHEGQET